MQITLPVDIQVIYCDDALLVINKPAGLRTLPDGYHPSLPHVKSLLAQEYGLLWIVHRLDKDTSGILLLARSATAHRSLNTQFEQRLVEKIYHVLVVGHPGWLETTISLPLQPNGDRQHRTVVDPAGKPAVTRLKMLAQLGPCSLLEANPETGRTHQLRAHLSAVGLPILGDRLYLQKSTHPEHKEDLASCEQDNTLPVLPEGIGLHARSLEFNHPITGERLIFTAPYSPGLKSVLRQLGSSAWDE